MFYDGGTFMGGMHLFWWIFWVALVGVIVFLGWGRSSQERRRSRDTPHVLLQRRLASGEIATEEYEKRRALLDRDAGANV